MSGDPIGDFVGTIKSFNRDRGYGFITCDDLRASGFTNDAFLLGRETNGAEVGDTVSFTAVQSDQGKPQATNVQITEKCPGRAASGGFLQSAPVATGAAFTGSVKSVSHKTGYGFIRCDDLIAQGYTNDVFVKVHQLAGSEPGDDVFFEAIVNEKGQPQVQGNVTPKMWRAPKGWVAGLNAWGGAWAPAALPGGVWGLSPAVCASNAGTTENAEWMQTAGDWAAGRSGVRREQQRPAGPDLGTFEGVVKSFNAKNGYGFIQCEELKIHGFQNDAFVHSHAMNGAAINPGDRVSFTAYMNEKGQPVAKDITMKRGVVEQNSGAAPKRAYDEASGGGGVPVGIAKRMQLLATGGI